MDFDLTVMSTIAQLSQEEMANNWDACERINSVEYLRIPH